MTSLYRYETLDEALQRANAVQFGLSASIFTHEPRATRRASRTRRRPGLLHVNSQTAGADVHVPFGGIKSSRLRARTSRAAPRSSSTPRASRSTVDRCERRAVPRHRRARLHRRVDVRARCSTRASTSSASTSATDDRLVPCSADGSPRSARAGRHRRPRRRSAGARRARDHARDPSGGAARAADQAGPAAAARR